MTYNRVQVRGCLCSQESNANSVAWNSHCEDMLCFSGNNVLSIKAGNFPVHQQKLMGFVVGVCGSKIFCLHVSTMSSIEVPLSAPMYQYLEKKMFNEAYRVACLGVTDGDWGSLAHAALDGLELEVAKKAFIRIKDLKYLELITDFQIHCFTENMGALRIEPGTSLSVAKNSDHRILWRVDLSRSVIQESRVYSQDRQRKGETEKDLLTADILAHRGKFKEAARLYQKLGQEQRALNMYTDLRMFDLAQVMRLTALGIISEGTLVDVGRRLDKADRDGLTRVARHLARLGQPGYATEMYRKLGDDRSIVLLYVEARDWRESFSLADKHPEYRDLVYIPYAQWLAENDKFVEAQKAFHKAGRPEEAFRVLQQLTENAVNESRFQDAAYYYWVLSLQCLDLANQSDTIIHIDTRAINVSCRFFFFFFQYFTFARAIAKYCEYFCVLNHSFPLSSHVVITKAKHKVINDDKKKDMTAKYYEHQKRASMYYAYDTIQKYLDEPFTSYMPEALFNISRYLMNELRILQPKGVSQLYPLVLRKLCTTYPFGAMP
uniref:(California timema) hypothetical protein n=1 Tax=Timema californicum TaxID=61474 RepID=A0A7R9J3S3_TIMCA|nr:unnamed protein product [Timema californicum]